MRPKKLARVGDRPSSSGVHEPTPTLAVEEAVAVGTPTVQTEVEAIDTLAVTSVETIALVSAPAPTLGTETSKLARAQRFLARLPILARTSRIQSPIVMLRGLLRSQPY